MPGTCRIAEKEGIEAEPQALHVIAQKADGGLRDALSIFDQLVSFSGNRLTYQDVVQNLNVLDHEHYFSITESIQRGDIAAALVEYNSILQQGFDGHLFVTGLARHFRDLLVAQDPRTLGLLEVSEELAQRYGVQAGAIQRDLLVLGLDRLAQCDSQYKQSKEPRLLVELTLIQLCRQAGGDSAGAEGSAEKKNPEREQRVAPAATERPVAPPPAAPAPTPAPVAVGTPAALPAMAANGDSPREQQPRRRLAGHISIKAAPEEPLLAATTETSELDREGAMPASTREVNATLLLKAWQDYALDQKRKGRNSLHATLMGAEPTVDGPGRIAFTIVNDVQENYMRSEKPELLGHLRRTLGDPGLDLKRSSRPWP